MSHMAPLPDYVAGTITLTNGSTAFTGSGTGWLAAGFREGDTILGIEDNPGVVYVVESVTGNDSGTLTQPWDGPTGTYTYRMRYLSDGQRVTAQARQLIEMLGNGNLQAFAGLGSVADTLPYFNGVGSMALTDLTTFSRSLLSSSDATAAREVLGADDAGNLITGTLPDARVSNTLSADKAYRQGNILGAVSQSGGIPTGAIIERGSNANGEYIKFADGTLICTHVLALGSRTFTGDGTSANPYRTNTAIWTFPSKFSSPPNLSGISRSEAIGALRLVALCFSFANTVSANNIQGGALSSSDTSEDVFGSVMAIGRWFD